MPRFSRQFLINLFLVVIIVTISLVVMLFSFAAKAVRYQNTAGVVHLRVEKKEYQISSQTIGTVTTVLVSNGQHVKRGDELVDLTNVVLDKQIALLQTLIATNPSASVQLVDLETQKEAQRVYAPTDGVVSNVVAEGQSVNTLETVVTMYSDSAVSLTGSFSLNDYALVQRNSGTLLIQNSRLNAVYPVTYAGTRQVIDTKNNPDANVTLVFALVNAEDAANMLQGERVDLHLVPQQASTKPIDYFINWYKLHILNLEPSS